MGDVKFGIHRCMTVYLESPRELIGNLELMREFRKAKPKQAYRQVTTNQEL